jgi:hypothetical protein
MRAHPLTTFVSETFGRQFSDLLLAGYGAEPGGRRKKLYLTEQNDGVEAGWVIELVARHPPYGDEPLVLAALLKLLLSRPSISNHLEFEPGELLRELRWQEDAGTRRKVETAITSYVRLLYDKQVDARAGRRASAVAGGGYYHLLTGYVRGTKPDSTGGSLIGTLSGVDFDARFIEGLRQGRGYFAGINFGTLNQTGDQDRN